MLLAADLKNWERSVNLRITAPLTQNQFDALVSLVFNVGSKPLYLTLGTKLNAGDYAGAADEFMKWCHAGGVEVAGLLRRREAERLLFLNNSDTVNL